MARIAHSQPTTSASVCPRNRGPERSQSEHLKAGLDSHARNVAPYVESLRTRSRHGFRDRPATATRQFPLSPLALAQETGLSPPLFPTQKSLFFISYGLALRGELRLTVHTG